MSENTTTTFIPERTVIGSILEDRDSFEVGTIEHQVLVWAQYLYLLSPRLWRFVKLVADQKHPHVLTTIEWECSLGRAECYPTADTIRLIFYYGQNNKRDEISYIVTVRDTGVRK